VVRPDGKISLPVIRDLQAGGLTPDRLAVQVQETVTQYMKDPDVSVSVLQVNSRTYHLGLGDADRNLPAAEGDQGL